MKKRLVITILFFILFSSIAFAHEVASNSKFSQIVQSSLNYIYIASIVMIVLSLISIALQRKLNKSSKLILFWLITIPVVLATICLVYATLYLNIKSPTHGPVHWHADFEIKVCDQNLMLEDPSGLMNRRGSPFLHEHNDMRIHIEGTPESFDSINLGEFFEAVGGEFTKSSLAFPTNTGIVTVKNGDLCHGKPGKLYLFVESQQARQREWHLEPLMDDYIISPYPNIPPGDRLKIIFSDQNQDVLLSQIKGGLL